MDDIIETTIKQFTIYDFDQQPHVDTLTLFDLDHLELIAGGLLTKVFHIKNSNWVLKESRWCIELCINHNYSFYLSERLIQKLVEPWSYKFLPYADVIQTQRGYFNTFLEYFGFFQQANDFPIKDHASLFKRQKWIRNNLETYISKVENFYSFKLSTATKKYIKTKNLYHNFLIKEYLFLGDSISSENKNKPTYFVLQQHVNGSPLYLLKSKHDQYAQQIKLLAYLILIMQMETKLVPDTRPHHIKAANNWLDQTNNLYAVDDQLKFIDTNWFWHTKRSIVKRGLIIPELIINQAKNTLKS